MWSVGISVPPCEDAERIGYDDRQITRIVIRMAQYFLERDLRVIFGHDCREDGVMRAVADVAGIVAARIEQDRDEGDPVPRMVKVVPEARSLSRAAVEAERDAGGVPRVFALDAGEEGNGRDTTAKRLMSLRHTLTKLLNPGCRVCLGGRTDGSHGNEPGVIEEAKLAVAYGKPLYLMGGFGGATRMYGDSDGMYRRTSNGLNDEGRKGVTVQYDGCRACYSTDRARRRLPGRAIETRLRNRRSACRSLTDQVPRRLPSSVPLGSRTRSNYSLTRAAR